MKSLKILFLILFSSFSVIQITDAQSDGGRLFGNLEMNANFYMRDSAIGADNTPQYDNQLFGVDAWLTLNYSNWGFDFGLRFDMFHNSALLNPTGSYNDQGIGRWYIHRRIDDLSITAGYIYDQIGSGVIFRAYEERPLLIDNALFGVRLAYNLTPDWTVRAFTGRQKRQFDTYGSVIRGLAIDGFYQTSSERPISFAPGFGVVARTLDNNTVDRLVNTLRFYTPMDREGIDITYNTYAFSLYNMLTAGPISWYVEAAYKTPELIFDPFALREDGLGGMTQGKLVQESGTVFYSTLSYSASGWGITLEGKRTEYFSFRTDPQLELNFGQINFLPPMSRQNTYRLTTRYVPATQELGELALQADVRYSPNRTWGFVGNFANITDLDGNDLYREYLLEVRYRYQRKWTLTGGVQRQEYNQDRFEGKPQAPIVETLTPFVEFLYRIDRRRSLKLEAQYMDTQQDFGSWLFLGAEYSIAPRWIFSGSLMYNSDPVLTDEILYPTLSVVYNTGANRFSLSYVKQVEGVVCTGGICRLEPAFSGVKFTLNSNF
ncbi:MAG: hypothetical protein EA362_06475 [Saprospirales bacterium]|nr:MAG: hypothetical protein EA362_06475 [Saprospirales bacterium]